MEHPTADVFIAAPEEAGTRLDKLLSERLPAHSRSRLKQLILAGSVVIDGAPVVDPSRKLKAGEEIGLVVPKPIDATPEPQDIPLVVVYEDADLIVVNKPAGMVVHPSAGHEKGTLVNALLHHCKGTLSGINGVMRPGIVHRLDKDTSGLLVVAKNDAAHQSLAAQFADHGRSGPLERLYLAFCWGVPLRARGTVEAALGRSQVNREKMTVVPEEKGRFAITHYAMTDSFTAESGAPVAALIECALETGRTHQIRVHMAHIGHPLLGDENYGAGFKTKISLLRPAAREVLSGLGRQALHAAVLGFEHPKTGEFLRFESRLPDDLTRLAEALRAG